MHIKMIETRRGSPDGHTIGQYHAGDTYEVPSGMGTTFVRNGWATEVTGEVVPASPVSPLGHAVEALARANTDFDRIFRPQPTRGSAPTNPQTLLAKGNDL